MKFKNKRALKIILIISFLFIILVTSTIWAITPGPGWHTADYVKINYGKGNYSMQNWISITDTFWDETASILHSAYDIKIRYTDLGETPVNYTDLQSYLNRTNTKWIPDNHPAWHSAENIKATTEEGAEITLQEWIDEPESFRWLRRFFL